MIAPPVPGRRLHIRTSAAEADPQRRSSSDYHLMTPLQHPPETGNNLRHADINKISVVDKAAQTLPSFIHPGIISFSRKPYLPESAQAVPGSSGKHRR